jgi:glycosyltransferase involved in cell wall biosynthesis
MTQLSVIIPTLNEATHLPGLLKALQTQTRPPDEIIIADAGSKDGTVELASAHGAQLVQGGMPGPGRNAGARAAHGDIFLFLDADVLPHPDFIENALDEFERDGYVVATCPTEALSDDISNKLIMDATNLYLQIIIPISPRAPGFCIFARRDVHQTIGGFDETLKMSEDHDYVRRASRQGEFGILASAHIPVSMRRLEKEGIVGLALKYLWCEMYALAGKPIRSMPFEYEFGAFPSPKLPRKQILVDITELRSLLGRFENPIQHLSSAGVDQFRRLTEFDPLDFATEHIRLLLERHDLDILEHYIQRRLTLIKENISLTDRLSKFKNTPGEIIHIIDMGRLHILGLRSEPSNDENNSTHGDGSNGLNPGKKTSKPMLKP